MIFSRFLIILCIIYPGAIAVFKSWRSKNYKAEQPRLVNTEVLTDQVEQPRLVNAEVQTDPRDHLITDSTRSPSHRYHSPELEAYKGTVSFVVDGRLYTIHKNSLMVHPDTLLARFVAARESGRFAGNPEDPIPFDSDPDIFKSVLNFYRYGTLQRPFGVPKTTFQMALHEFALEHYLDGGSMEEFDEQTRQIEEIESSGNYARQLVYSYGHNSEKGWFCVNVGFKGDKNIPTLPPAQSENMRKLLMGSCESSEFMIRDRLSCCYTMKIDGPIPMGSIYFVGLEIERKVPGLEFKRHVIYPTSSARHEFKGHWGFQAEYIFDLNIS